jgi:hypothetical protein
MKVVKKIELMPIVERCVTDRELFDTELILRAQKAGLKKIEFPIACREKRQSTSGIARRIPRTIADIFKLFYYLKIRK